MEILLQLVNLKRQLRNKAWGAAEWPPWQPWHSQLQWGCTFQETALQDASLGLSALQALEKVVGTKPFILVLNSGNKQTNKLFSLHFAFHLPEMSTVSGCGGIIAQPGNASWGCCHQWAVIKCSDNWGQYPISYQMLALVWFAGSKPLLSSVPAAFTAICLLECIDRLFVKAVAVFLYICLHTTKQESLISV